MLEMYKGVANSPETTITNDINNLDTIIYVLDETRIPELPNIMVLGNGISAETVKVLSIEGNALTVERGFQGVPKSWNTGTIIARNFTEYDYNALVENVEELDSESQDTKDIVGMLEDLTTDEKANLVSAINEVKAQSNENATDVNAHKAESMTERLLASRDASIAGVQSFVTQRKPKHIIIQAMVLSTNKVSQGSWSANGNSQQVFVREASTINQMNTGVVSIADTVNNRTVGAIQNVTATGFEINWTKLFDTGGTGTANLLIDVFYHGED